MVSFPNAKINLGLQILRKRTDGYHDISSVFYPIKWADILEIIPSESFQFTSSGLEIPGNPSQNLIVKAYELIRTDFLDKVKPVAIHLHKIIPMGAGLGGGSADASFTLKMLNELFSLELTTTELENYARKLGSDCAFFIENKPVYCFHKGDEFAASLVSLAGKTLVVINPMIHISTAEAYQHAMPTEAPVLVNQLIQQPMDTWKNQLANDFEKGLSAKYPLIAQLKEKLYEEGAIYASMTGSGSTLYGIFEQPIDTLVFKEWGDFMIWQGLLD